MPRFSAEALDDIFKYHPPPPEDLPKFTALRDGAKEFARLIRDNTPESPDQTTAIRKVREAIMIANASIALGGRY